MIQHSNMAAGPTLSSLSLSIHNILLGPCLVTLDRPASTLFPIYLILNMAAKKTRCKQLSGWATLSGSCTLYTNYIPTALDVLVHSLPSWGDLQHLLCGRAQAHIHLSTLLFHSNTILKRLFTLYSALAYCC